MDASGIAQGLGTFLIGAALVCFFVGVLIASIVGWTISKDYIESDKPITPEMIITTNGVQSDTLYIYREP